MTTATASSSETYTPLYPPFLADGGQPRFHWEHTAGQVALSVDPHGRCPRLEHTIIWLMRIHQHSSPAAPNTELLRHTHQVLHPELGTLAGLMRYETPPLMKKLESLYADREMHLQDLRDWHTDFLAVSPFLHGNHEVAAAVLAARSFPVWHKFLAPGQ